MADHSADRPCSPDCHECCRLMIDARDQRRFDKATESLHQQLTVARAALAECWNVLREVRLSLPAAIDDLRCANRLQPDEVFTYIAAQKRLQQLRNLCEKIDCALTNPDIEHVTRIEAARNEIITSVRMLNVHNGNSIVRLADALKALDLLSKT